MSKVTDLEHWAMSQVWMPYYPLFPDALGDRASYQEKLADIRKRAGSDFLQGTLDMLNTHPDIAKRVVNRLGRIGDYFPDYVHHPLVDWMHDHRVMKQ